MAIQSIMYVSLGLWIIVLLHMIGGHPISIDYIFRYQVISILKIYSILLDN